MSLSNNSQSYENSSSSPRSVNKEEQFQNFLNDLKAKLRRGYYKKVIKEIDDNTEMFQFMEHFWTVKEIEVRCYLKVIKRKIINYEFSANKRKSIDIYLNKAETQLENFYNTFCEKHLEDQLDIYLELFLNLLYLNALVRKNDKEFFDCLGFLATAEKLIKEKLNSDSKVVNPRFYSVSQRIYLLLSSIAISNSDFDSSIEYQNQSLILCHKELLTITDLDEAIDINNLHEHDRHHHFNLFLNVFLIFYHRGVTEENSGNYLTATDCFRDAKWFALKFVKSSCPGLAQFISDVETRVKGYKKVLYKTTKVNKKKKLFGKNFFKKLVMKSIKKTETERQRFERVNYGLIKQIKTLKFNNLELPDERKNSDYINELTYSLKIVNKLMSNRVKGILTDLDKLNLHNLDKETKEKIQKKINLVNLEEKLEKYQKEEEENILKESKIAKHHSTKSSASKIKGSKLSELNIREIKIPAAQSLNFDSNTVGELKKNLNNSSNSSSQFKKNLFPSSRNDGVSTAISQFQEFLAKPVSERKKTVRLISDLDIGSLTNRENFQFVLPDKAFNFLTESTNRTTQDSESKKVNSIRNDLEKIQIPDLSLNGKEISFKGTQASSKSKTFVKKKEPVEKYNYSKFITNKKFQKKLHALDTISQKEIEFQKQILAIKRNENIPVLINSDINEAMRKDLELKMKTINLAKPTYAPRNKQTMARDILERKLVKNLETKTFGDYKDYVRRVSESRIKLRKEFLQRSDTLHEEVSINKANEEYQKKIEQEIQLMEKLERKHRSVLNPEKKKVVFKRKSIVEHVKQPRPVEHFIRLKSTKSNTSFI